MLSGKRKFTTVLLIPGYVVITGIILAEIVSEIIVEPIIICSKVLHTLDYCFCNDSINDLITIFVSSLLLTSFMFLIRMFQKSL